MNLNMRSAYQCLALFLIAIIYGIGFILSTSILDDIQYQDDMINTDKPNHYYHPDERQVVNKFDAENRESNDVLMDDEPTDYEIWLAIKNSMENWRNQQIQQQMALNNGTRSRKRRDEESVCYEHFGCFRHKGPFDYLNTLPASPELIATTFTLYTRRNPIEGEPLDYNDDMINSNSSVFNNTNDVKIIIHGFGSSSKRPWVMKMTEALLELDDFNVISVDWQNGSKLPNYVQAAANTQLIGKQIAKLIRTIDRLHHMPPSRYHLIGFSLGAHVAAFTGQEIANISRITGLDPASPLFEGYPPNVRLDPTDAQFVDVIHSNGDGFIRGGLGSYEPMGSVDFYPNGGRVQVGCSSALGVLTNIFYHGQWNLLCNHRRAFRFFIDSVHRECTFRAFSCPSYEEYVRGHCFDCGVDGRTCSNMGYYSHLSLGRGPMYLVTRDKEPFCVNQFRVQIQFSMKQGVTWGQIVLQLINVDGLNETFALTQEADQLKEAEQIQTLIVAHPKLTNITEVTLTYARYKGWIYYGQNEWNVDRIELLDSNFVIKTYCRPRTTLVNTISIRLKLLSTNCTIEYNYYENNDNDYVHNSIISNAIIPEPVVPSIMDVTSTIKTPEEITTSHYHLHQHQLYNMALNSDHSHLRRRPHLPGEVIFDYEPTSITIVPQLSKSEPFFELLERSSQGPKKFYKIERLTNSLISPSLRSQVLKRPLGKYVNGMENMRVSIAPSTTSRPQQVDARYNRERSINIQPRTWANQQTNALENSINGNGNSIPTEISELEIVPSSNHQSQPESQQSSSFITPIINGASKIFWKFWNNFNSDLSANNDHNSTEKHFSKELKNDDNPSSVVRSESLVMVPSEYRPVYPNRMHVDRIFTLTEDKDYERIRSSKVDENQDDSKDNENGQSVEEKNAAHYVLYSILPISTILR